MKKALLILSVILLAACNGKEEIPNYLTVKSNQYTLKVSDTGKIEAESNTAITYTSNNVFVAVVDNNGQVIAKTTGKTTIIVSDENGNKKTVSLEVLAKTDFSKYKFPIIEIIGRDYSSAHKTLETYYGYSNKIIDTSKMLGYIVKDKATHLYAIDNNSIQSISIKFANTLTGLATYQKPFSEYLLENFTAILEKNDYFTMISSDLKITVLFSLSEEKPTYILETTQDIKDLLIKKHNIVL